MTDKDKEEIVDASFDEKDEKWEFRLSICKAIGAYRKRISPDEIMDAMIVQLLEFAAGEQITFRWLLKRIAYLANERASEDYWGEVKDDIPKELLDE
jgi:hypothetical protein